MKASNYLSFLLVVLLVSNSFSAFGLGVKPNQTTAVNHFLQPSEKAQKWAEKTLHKMSPNEKIGQLVSIGINAQFWNEDSDAFGEIKRQIVDNKIGGVCLFGSPVYEAVRVTNRMQVLAKVPLLISSDFEAGIGMRFENTINFPWNMAVAATNEPELAKRQGAMTAKEARALGVQQIFAPVVDVNNNSLNPVINVRSYGENPTDVSRFANAFIEGIQSNNALATVKHFPGHGDTAVDSHRGLPIIDLPRSRFDQIELLPFRSAIEAGVASVMIGHISLPQIEPTEIKPLEKSIKSTYVQEGGEIKVENATLPASLSPIVQTNILRKEMNFRGLIVTDAMDMSGLTLYFNQDEAGVRAFLAGADMLIKPSDPDAIIRGLREAVKSGRISQTRLDESVRKILAIKYELGLVDNKIASFDEVDKLVASKAAGDLAEEIATKAITLVKNETNAVPLAKDKRIFVFGITNGDDRNFIANTFLRSLRQNSLQFETAILDERTSEIEVNIALTKARAADVIIAPLYGRVRTGAKTSVGLPETAEKVLQQLLSENRNIIGISFGNPYLLMEFPKMKTYLVAYGDMPSLQRAAARSLLGQQTITGRLPISLPGLYKRGTGIQLEKR
ncbi:MAG: glycoside hydrolase family 3 N-terminal domain-containing protein [Pyrinomonadaceae bacterium]